MKIKCSKCKRTQEVSEIAWKISQEGLPSGLPEPLNMLSVHPFTCCGTSMIKEKNMNLKDKVKKSLQEKSPQTIPSLCRNIPEITNEFAIMRAVGELEHSEEVILTGFERIYREDGGALYLAEYSIVK
jgi:hypothetical protein